MKNPHPLACQCPDHKPKGLYKNHVHGCGCGTCVILRQQGKVAITPFVDPLNNPIKLANGSEIKIEKPGISDFTSILKEHYNNAFKTIPVPKMYVAPPVFEGKFTFDENPYKVCAIAIHHTQIITKNEGYTTIDHRGSIPIIEAIAHSNPCNCGDNYTLKQYSQEDMTMLKRNPTNIFDSVKYQVYIPTVKDQSKRVIKVPT